MTTLTNLLFVSHLLGAAVSLSLVLGALLALGRKRATQYAFWARSLAFVAVFQILSGVGLAVLMAAQTSLLSVCARLAVYLVIICAVETVLIYRLKQTAVIPTRS